MASGKSNYLSNKLLNQIFNAASYSFPATIYCALFTIAPNGSGGGTEVSGGSYARQPVTCNTGNFATTSTESITNLTAIIFTPATGSWGTVVAAAFFDALTAGNMLYFGALTSNVTVASGNTFEFLASGFTVTEA